MYFDVCFVFELFCGHAMPVKHPETERKETLQKSVVLKVTQVAWSALKVRPTAAGSLACCRRLYEYDNSS